MPKLSVVIITHNEEQNILRCLESVKPVADEIVVVDSRSADLTVQICREFGCTVFSHDFEGYGNQKQFAIDQASNDWVLSIDADEVVTEDLKTELIRIFGKAGDKATESQSNKVTEVIGAETESSLPSHYITWGGFSNMAGWGMNFIFGFSTGQKAGLQQFRFMKESK